MVNGFKPPHNADILTAVRNNASADYWRRIPEATQANIQDTVQALSNNPPHRNEFVNALMNMFAEPIIRSQNWENPFGKFKRGMIPYGSTIEEIQVGLIDAYVYNHDREYLERDLFGTHRPEVQTSFHTVNRQNFYPITVNEMTLRRAFQSDTGLSTFINQVIQSAVKSDAWDEFLVMTRLFAEYDKMDGFFRVNTPDISAPSAGMNETNFALRRIREFAGKLPYISRHYNAAGMPVAADVNELELFITPEANAAMDVESLAGAFNVERAAVPTRTTVIPKEHFGIPGVQAILTTRDFFVVADTLYETRNQPNAAALQENYFLHHWQIVSASRFVPAVMFTTGAGDVINVVDYDVTGVDTLTIQDRNEADVTGVIRGEYYQISGEAVTDPEGGPNRAIRYELTGDVGTSSRTYITQTGALFVAYDEQSDNLTVTATSVDDNEFTATLELPVSGDKVTYWPASDDSDVTEVTPDEPTAAGNDITIPAVTGVQYQVSGEAVTGTYTMTADTTVVAVPEPGYVFPDGAVSQWEFTYTA